MEPSVETFRWARLLWPLGIVVAPIALWILCRRAVQNTRHSPELHSHIRRASLVLGLMLSASSAVAALIQFLSHELNPQCLIQVPPVSPWGYGLLGVSALFLVLLMAWVWLGQGAVELSAFGSALARRPHYALSHVRWAITAYAIGAPLLIIVAVKLAGHASTCAPA